MELEIKKRAVSNTINRARTDAPVTTPSIVDLKSNEVTSEELSKGNQRKCNENILSPREYWLLPILSIHYGSAFLCPNRGKLVLRFVLIKDNRARILYQKLLHNQKNFTLKPFYQTKKKKVL